MSSQEYARIHEEGLERATRQATDFIRAQHADPEAWVRLLVTERKGDQTIFHFDAFWPTWGEQARVVVQRDGAHGWQATRVAEPLAP